MQLLYSDRMSPTNPLSGALDALSFTSAMTLAATIATLPLIAFYFQRVSLIGLPTTALALPALPPILVTTNWVTISVLYAAMVLTFAGMLFVINRSIFRWDLDTAARIEG